MFNTLFDRIGAWAYDWSGTDVPRYYYKANYSSFNPIALRKAKIVNNFGLSECNRVIIIIMINTNILNKKHLQIRQPENETAHEEPSRLLQHCLAFLIVS